MKNPFKTFMAYAFYPFLLTILALIIFRAINHHWDYKTTYGLTTLGLVLTLVAYESIFPLSKKWKMTGKSFLRDLKYIAVDLPVIVLTKSAFGSLAIYYSEHHEGLFTKGSFLLSVIGFLLTFEFFQYGYHRLSHLGRGTFGKFLWNVHLAHHLPDKVYVVMHAVFNPVNAFLTAIIIQLPLILLGISPEAVLAATLLIDLQSLISHFNADIRGGYLNYIFIGTETHRFHHSADMNESKNFGNTLAIWDILFGTFYYKPGAVPNSLGIQNPENYPVSDHLWKVISYPWVKLNNPAVVGSKSP